MVLFNAHHFLLRLYTLDLSLAWVRKARRKPSSIAHPKPERSVVEGPFITTKNLFNILN